METKKILKKNIYAKIKKTRKRDDIKSRHKIKIWAYLVDITALQMN